MRGGRARYHLAAVVQKHGPSFCRPTPPNIIPVSSHWLSELWLPLTLCTSICLGAVLETSYRLSFCTSAHSLSASCLQGSAIQPFLLALPVHISPVVMALKKQTEYNTYFL